MSWLRSIRRNITRIKNRKRFEEVVSNKNSSPLAAIFRDFEKGKKLSDEEVLKAYQQFSEQIQTNTISAAELEFVVVATILSYQPNLTDTLLYQPLLMMVCSFGDEINIDTVIEFLEVHILHYKAEPYGGIPKKKAVEWLEDYIPNNKDKVQQKLAEVIQKNSKELEGI